MTLNFELATGFLFATHPFVMIIICATLFINPNIDDQVMVSGFTEIYAHSLSADCDIDPLPNDMVFVYNTLFCHDDHLYQIIFKSHHA